MIAKRNWYGNVCAESFLLRPKVEEIHSQEIQIR